MTFKMKLELSDSVSNHSDFSNDSQNSQMSTADFMTSMGNGTLLLTPTTTFIALEGLNSGVPTRTTPTLTPTTLRNIEQTFIELQSKPESHENEAGFVPPLVQSIGNNQYISINDVDIYPNVKSPNLWHSSLSQSSSDSNTRSTPPLQKSSPNNNNNTTSGQTRRNMGGRKPAKDLNCTPEEEERRKVRRERNKAAAARCRKRRVDHTNTLINETDDLQRKKESLQKEYQELIGMKEELEYLLGNHENSPNCCLKNHRSNSPPDIKPNLPSVYSNGVDHHHIHDDRLLMIHDHDDERVKTEMLPSMHQQQHQHAMDTGDMFSLPSPAKRIMLSSTAPILRPSRPNSLNVGAITPKTSIADLIGIPISTPSTGMQFNFDSLMVGGTGLTPVSAPLVPSCSSQQRNLPVSIADVTSPDACGPPKLVSL